MFPALKLTAGILVDILYDVQGMTMVHGKTTNDHEQKTNNQSVSLSRQDFAKALMGISVRVKIGDKFIPDEQW